MTEPMVLGYDEAGSGPVLFLIHGFPLDRTLWEGQLEGLKDIRRVVAVDLRGRGKSEAKPNGWSVDLYADDVAKTIESLGSEPADIAGLSMGGYVVFALLRRHPEMVRSVILIDTKAGDDPPEAKEGREKTAATVREQGTLAVAEGLIPKLVSPGASQEVKKKALAMAKNTPGETVAADALAMRDRPDSTSDLGMIKVPAVVIHGEDDQLMPVAGAKEMADLIPGAKFVTIPRAGHLAPLENPLAVNDALRNFLP